MRRFLALSSCGAVAGIGWWLLYRFGAPLVSIRHAIQKGGRTPFGVTPTHAIPQIVTVGLGSRLGGEVAPRELGAAMATKLSARANLTLECTRIMIACGAEAGLAAAYNVPLGRNVFTLEAPIIGQELRAPDRSPKTAMPAQFSIDPLRQVGQR